MIDALISLCRRPQLIDRVCLKLGISETHLAKLVKEAQAKGCSLRIKAGAVSIGVPIGQRLGIPWLAPPGDRPGRQKVAYFTDTHFGSSHCDTDGIVRFLKLAWGEGCRVALHTGDLLDGNKPVLLPDQKYAGLDGQLGQAVRTLKRAPKFTYIGITGNHDGYFSASSGMDAGALTDARMGENGIDWRHAGTCYGRAHVLGANVTLWHPSGGAGTRNAVRRVLNEKAESLEHPCDILVMGHLHRYVSFQAYPEKILCVAGGTFQKKLSEFANRITRPWDVGGVILSWDYAGGEVSHASAEFYPL